MVQTKQTKLTAAVGEEIGQELGAQFISAYRQANSADVCSYFIGRTILDQVLAQPGCMGIRFYNAYNEAGEKTLVYVGVNAQGTDMLNITTVSSKGQLDVQKGIVADRVRTEPDKPKGGVVDDNWWEF